MKDDPRVQEALERINSPRKEVLQKIIDDIPVLHRLTYARVLAKILPRSKAIKAKCLECCGFEDVVDRVGNCTTYRCPLWVYRPYQKGTDEDHEQTSAT